MKKNFYLFYLSIYLFIYLFIYCFKGEPKLAFGCMLLFLLDLTKLMESVETLTSPNAILIGSLLCANTQDSKGLECQKRYQHHIDVRGGLPYPCGTTSRAVVCSVPGPKIPND